ncbi:MAG: T9SS type A sorting domain-containing protein [Bacteroidia bacterium]
MKKAWIILIVLISSIFKITAQDGFTSTGGDNFGSTGSEAFSTGLVVYTEISGPSGSASQGIQFAHELYVINVKEETADLSLSVYPNPSSNLLNIQFKGEVEYQYRLYNMLGMNICTGKVQKGNTSIHVEQLPAGLYLLDILQENKNIKSYKIIKK